MAGCYSATFGPPASWTPTGITTNTWDYGNMRTLVLLPSGARETMTYNADLRMARMRT
jgi:hypothetical protein